MDTDSIDIALLKNVAQEATNLIKVLANSDRLMLLCELSQGERCVSDLETRLAISQPTLSQQLTVLRNAALVHTRRDGKYIYYQLSDPKALAIMQTLYQQFCAPHLAQAAANKQGAAAAHPTNKPIAPRA